MEHGLGVEPEQAGVVAGEPAHEDRPGQALEIPGLECLDLRWRELQLVRHVTHAQVLRDPRFAQGDAGGPAAAIAVFCRVRCHMRPVTQAQFSPDASARASLESGKLFRSCVA